MSIEQDIEDIANAESGESVRSAIISAIQDLNQNGGNAQTLNNHSSDDFTKKAEFDDFVDEEVGQIHLVLDAINKGTSLKVIDLGVKTIGPQGGVLAITVPASVKDRNLLTVDDFYADIVEIAAGSGENVHWTKTDSYDNVSCEYRYAYSALASAIKLHFYAKRASAIVVPDYDVHPYPGQVRENKVLQAEAGEAWNYIDVMVPSGGKTEIEQTFNENGEFTPTDPNTTWGKVIIDVSAPTPELQTGSVTVGQATYHQEFNPTAPYVGFSKFTVDVNVPMPSIQTDRQVTMNTSGYVNPESGYDAMSTVYVTVPVQPSIQTGKSVTLSASGDIYPDQGYDAMEAVHVNVPTQPSIQPSKSVTLSQSGTITPDPNYDAMEEVVVTVSGGGGGNCYICTQDVWDAMPMSEKKSKGLTVIKNSAGQTTGYWMDLTNIVLDIIGEFYGKSSTVIQLNQQTINHLIYFQGKWQKNGWDNGLINHTGVAYSSMDTGNETIRNGSGVTNKMTSILHDVSINSGATITFSIGAAGYDINDGAFAVGVPFASTVEIIGEHFSASAETIVTDKHYDYVLFMANKWSYGQDSSNGTYSISSGTLVQSGSETIVVDGATVPAIAVYSNVPSGTTITLGNRDSGSIDSIAVIGINEITS